jgi:hypothetical protein
MIWRLFSGYQSLTRYFAGLLHLKRIQEETLPTEAIYIRRAIEIPNFEGRNQATNSYDKFDGDDTEDLDPENNLSTPFRMVVCMFREASFLLHSAQYLQSDIGFKRVIGFQEFELGGLDSESRTSKSLAASIDYLEFNV